MLLPVMIERLEQNAFLHVVPHARLDILRLYLNLLRDHIAQPGGQDFRLDRVFFEPHIDRRLFANQIGRFLFQSGNIPLLGIGTGRTMLIHDRVDRIEPHILDHIINRIGIHHVRALLVNHLALVVHDVVIFHNLLARLIVARLHLLLRRLDRLAEPFAADRLAIFQAGIHHARKQRFAAEDAQQIVLQAQIEAAEARIALTARTAAQLIVDAAAFMPFRAQHEQTAGFQHLRLFGCYLFLDAGNCFVARRAFFQIGQFLFDPEFQIAAKLNIGAASSHVGGDRHRAQASRLRHDMRFAFMHARIQDVMRHALAIEIFGQKLGLLDRHRAHQHWLANLVLLLDRHGDGGEFIGDVLVELVVLVDPLDRQVGRHFRNVELVDFVEFARFRGRCAGHAGKLGIHAEIVLEGDGRHRLVFRLDVDAFLSLDRLMQAIGPAATVHHAAGELIDDDDLAVLHDIVRITLEHQMRAHGVLDMMDDQRVFKIIEVGAFEQPGLFQHPLDFLRPVFGQQHALGFFVLLVIIFGQLRDDAVDRRI